MALVLADRVQETSTTTGTGTLTLDGAVLGFQTFAAGIGSGNTCYYAITNAAGAWEVGIGTVGTGTLARTTLLSSSTGSLVSFTGTLNVYVTYPSEKSVNLDASNIITGYPITVADNVFTLQDNVDPTKQAQFQVSAVPTATTAVYNLPYSATNPVALAALNVPLTYSSNQTFSATSNSFGTSTATGTTSLAVGATLSGSVKTVNIGTGGLSGSTTNIAIGSSVSGATSTTTMNGTTNFLDTGFTLQDNADTTKQARFELSGLTTGTTFTYTLPAVNTTLVGLSSTNTFTGTNNFSALNNSFGTYAGAATSTTGLSIGAQTGTKTVNVGTGGVSGSTTNITIGSTFGTITNLLGILQLAGSAGTSGQVLTSAGASTPPTWAAPVSSNITANGLFENNATISANYTIGTGNNAVSAGPITINSGIVVTVPSGSTWVVV